MWLLRIHITTGRRGDTYDAVSYDENGRQVYRKAPTRDRAVAGVALARLAKYIELSGEEPENLLQLRQKLLQMGYWVQWHEHKAEIILTIKKKKGGGT